MKKSAKLLTIVFTLAGMVVISLLPSCQSETQKKEVTYTQDVAQILNTHCIKCHHPGGAGPFSLMEFRQAARKSKTIAKVTRKGYMPPWPADRNYTTFLHEPTISESEIDILQRWAEAGAPYGDSSKLPEKPEVKPHFIDDEPDLAVGFQKRVYISGDNRDRFFALKIPVELPRDTFLRAIEFIPGNRKLLHHMNGHLVNFNPDKIDDLHRGRYHLEHDSIPPRALAQQMGFEQTDGSYPTLIPSVVNYLPGVGGTLYPEGIGGWSLSRKFALYLNDLHYGPSPKDDSDSSYFHLYFTDKPPKRPVRELHLGTLGVAEVVPPLIVPPNEEKAFTITYTVPEKISVLTVNPHMHLLGKRFKAYALTPQKDTIRLVKIDRWDFRWQFFYTYPNPVILPAGSVIKVEALMDNTANNKHNPNTPPRWVYERDGSMRTTDEMLQFFVMYIKYEEGDEGLDLSTSD